MKKMSMGLISIIGIIVIVLFLFITNYNGMVDKSETVDAKFSNIDTQLQRRADLIPNLVNSVKGIMTHEQAAIAKITDARTKLVNANGVSEKAAANNELTTALNNFMVIAEAYPDLKANTNYTNLMDELAGTENRIATSRKDYNDAVKEYNSYIKRMPNSIVAGIFNFKEKEYFKAAEDSNEVPQVNFE